MGSRATLVPAMAIAIVVASLAGCAAQRPSPDSGPTLLIAALTADPSLRQTVEEATVRALQRQGVDAIASFGDVPELGADARQQLEAAARAHRATAVLALRGLGLTDDGELVDHSPVPVTDMAFLRVFYAAARLILADAPAPDQRVLVVSAYELASKRLIWGGVSWTFDLTDPRQRLDEAVGMLAENVSEAIRQRRQMSGA